MYPGELLNQHLQLFIEQIGNKSLLYTDFFQNQYITGLRFCELQEGARWEVGGDGKYTCTTAKGSYPRIFTEAELSLRFRNSLINNTNIYKYVSNIVASRFFYNYNTYYRVQVGKKILTTHLFRHNKAKYLFAHEYTRAAIQQYLGEVSIQNSNGYIDSDLTVYPR